MPDTPIAEAAAADAPAVIVSDGAAKRIAMIAKAEGKAQPIFRISVSGGGCSGFQYGFALADAVNPDDKVFEKDGVKVVVDEVSLDLVRGAELAFVDDLIGAYFQMRNPNASSTCGCGSSFSL